MANEGNTGKAEVIGINLADHKITLGNKHEYSVDKKVDLGKLEANHVYQMAYEERGKSNWVITHIESENAVPGVKQEDTRGGQASPQTQGNSTAGAAASTTQNYQKPRNGNSREAEQQIWDKKELLRNRCICLHYAMEMYKGTINEYNKVLTFETADIFVDYVHNGSTPEVMERAKQHDLKMTEMTAEYLTTRSNSSSPSRAGTGPTR